VFNPGASSPIAFFGPGGFVPRPEILAKHWVIRTYDSPQTMGTEPWGGLQVFQVTGPGALAPRDFAGLLGQATGGPVVFVVHGNLIAYDAAVNGSLWVHDRLDRLGALPPAAVVVGFDWPGEQVYRLDPRDLAEKQRRAFVAGYHLARVVQALPAGCPVTLIGHSDGGRAVAAALHLLGGGGLGAMSMRDPVARLPASRPDLRLRAVLVAAAVDRHWLDPGERLDRALPACEGLLNLYNRRDEALPLYPLDLRTDHRRAIGRVGLANRDFARLGPLAARYVEEDLRPIIGRDHSLTGAVASPGVAARVAPYTWAAP
jgi:hypothetical protein